MPPRKLALDRQGGIDAETDPGGAVLVTGGAGFIGSNLVRTLVAAGESVVALDNQFLGRWSNLDGVACEQVLGDCLHDAFLDELVRVHQVDRVCHLAGYTSAPMYDEAPRERIADNLAQFLGVLDLARRHRLRVAYASTSSFYARCPKPFREDMTIVPATPYEFSKYAMEQAAHMYHLQHKVVANGLRFFSVYGPFERHKGRYANNISQFYWSIRAGLRPVVFGDGSQTRDFTFVGDLVEAIRLVLDRGRASEVYNIGTGQEHSFNEMIRLINQELGTDVQPLYVRNPLSNYVQETLADTTKIRRELGWRATTNLAAGIRRLHAVTDGVSRADAESLYAWIRQAVRPAAAAKPNRRDIAPLSAPPMTRTGHCEENSGGPFVGSWGRPQSAGEGWRRRH